MNEILVSEYKEVRWGTPFLIVGGAVWIIRAGLEVVFQPDYWNPRSAVDYTAVAGTSLALILLTVL